MTFRCRGWCKQTVECRVASATEANRRRRRRRERGGGGWGWRPVAAAASPRRRQRPAGRVTARRGYHGPGWAPVPTPAAWRVADGTGGGAQTLGAWGAISECGQEAKINEDAEGPRQETINPTTLIIPLLSGVTQCNNVTLRSSVFYYRKFNRLLRHSRT